MTDTPTTLDAARTAALFIDFQHDVCARGGRMLSEDDEVLARFEAARAAAAAWLERCRAADPSPRVVHVSHGFEPGYPELRDGHTNNMSRYVQKVGAFIKGDAGAAIVPELAPAEGELHLCKHSISPFATTALGPWLQQRSVDTLVIAGVVTHYAVLGAALVANDLGYRVVVPRDTCASGGLDRHETALAILGPLVEVVDSQALTWS